MMDYTKRDPFAEWFKDTKYTCLRRKSTIDRSTWYFCEHRKYCGLCKTKLVKGMK